MVSPEILETAYLCPFSDDVVLGGPYNSTLVMRPWVSGSRVRSSALLLCWDSRLNCEGGEAETGEPQRS